MNYKKTLRSLFLLAITWLFLTPYNAISAQSIEGIYELAAYDSTPLRMSIVDTGSGQLVVGLISLSENGDLGSIDKSFFNIRLDTATGEYVASSRSVDPKYQSTIIFKFPTPNEIELKDYSHSPAKIYYGKKAANLPSYTVRPIDPKNLVGTYKGLAYYSAENPSPVELILRVQEDGNLRGQLRALGPSGEVVAAIDYPITSSPNESFLRLTSQRLRSGAFNHLRLDADQNTLSGVLVVGARQATPVKIELSK